MLRCVRGPRSPHVSSWCGLWFLLPHESSQRFLPAVHPPPTRCHLEGLVGAACHRLPLCPGSQRSPCCYKEMALNP